MINTKVKTILALTVLVFIAGNLGWLKNIENFFKWSLNPLLSSARSISLAVAEPISSIFILGDVRSENDRLREKVKILESENSKLLSELDNQEDLRQALNLKNEFGLELLGAKIVSVDPASFNQVYVINRGSVSGIIEGQAVLDAFGAYVGRVTQVLRNTSEITLITDSNSRLPAKISGTETKGIVQGQHGLTVQLIEVPQGQEIPSEARIVTTSFIPGVPEGVLLGYTGALKSEPGEVFQTVDVVPAADLNSLRLVFIVVGSK